MKRIIPLLGLAMVACFCTSCIPPDMFHSWAKVYLENGSSETLYYEWPEQEEISETSLKDPGSIAAGERKLVGEDMEKQWLPIARYALRLRKEGPSGTLVKEYDVLGELGGGGSGLAEQLSDEDGKKVYLVHATQALVDAAGETP